MGDESGFTLMEMVLVIIITGILIGVAVISWPGMETTLAGHSRRLAADLDLARAMAMARGDSVTITHTAGSGSYSITDSGGGVLHSADGFAAVAMDSFTMAFDAYGSPGSADTDIDMVLNGKSITVRVVGLTGAVVEP